MRRPATDAVIGLVLLVLCAELYRETFHFRVPPFATMSVGAWPRFVLVVLALLCVGLIVQAMTRRTDALAASSAPSARPISHRNALICFGLFAAFLVSLHWLGMLIAGVLFVFIMQEMMGPRSFRSRLFHAAIALVAVGGMWSLFTFALRVILPEGLLLRL
ncbi:MAG TPA: tripartite tricarboxylate transporter TctB family protein [Hyphomicrobiaceae bacterium]|nr:tripartite tricarboxylate transporter TctB family protein [Hyphomicrobiaceae bacterium]